MILDKVLQVAGNIFRYLWDRYSSFENVFQLLGLIIGFIVSIILLAAGVAAIPFTGGASLLPAWIGALAFFFIVTTTFLAAGRMMGILIDTVIDFIQGVRVNNEKLATAIACAVGLIFVVAALPLHFVVVPFIAAEAVIPVWQGFMIFLPATISSIAAIGRHIGRTIDRHVQQKISTHDLLNKVVGWIKGEEQVADLRNTVTHDKLVDGHWGIKLYLGNRGVEKYQYLTVAKPIPPATLVASIKSRFDPKTGKNRGVVYHNMLKDKNAPTDLQKAIVLYTMLKSGRGRALRETVRENMGYGSVVEAKEDLRKYIHQHLLALEDRKFLQEHVTNKLGLFANNGKTFKNRKGRIQGDYDLIIGTLNRPQFRGA
jgi:hypothetical protein